MPHKRPEITLAPDGQHYVVEGRLYERTTHVVGILDPELQRLKIERPAMLREAADFGTKVHEVTMYQDRGEYDTVDRLLNECIDVLPFLLAWNAWTQQYVKRWIHVEYPVWSDTYGCAGTIDRIAVMQGDPQPCILDIKTGSLHDNIGVQLAAYRMFYNDEVRTKGRRVERIYAVNLPRREPGVLKKVKDYTTDIRRYEARFRDAVDMYRQMKGDAK
jgi:hypothetical protein